MTKPSRIIDAHQHVFWHGRDDAGLVKTMDEFGIAKAVVLTWELSDVERSVGCDDVWNPVHSDQFGRQHPGLPLADAVRAVRHFPDRFVLGYCPHPVNEQAIAWLDAAIRMYDVRVCGEWKCRLQLDDPRCVELFRYCGVKGLPVQLHIDTPWAIDRQTGQRKYDKLWYGGAIDNLERAMQLCPDTLFLGHGPGFWREISGDADHADFGYPAGPVTPDGRIQRLFEKYANLWGDLSGFSGLNALQRDPEHGLEFLKAYHQRLLFARDFYDNRLQEFLNTLDLPQDVAEDIYHRNAEKVYRIEP